MTTTIRTPAAPSTVTLALLWLRNPTSPIVAPLSSISHIVHQYNSYLIPIDTVSEVAENTATAVNYYIHLP